MATTARQLLAHKGGVLPVHCGLQMGSFNATESVLSYSKGANRGEYEQGRLDSKPGSGQASYYIVGQEDSKASRSPARHVTLGSVPQ